MRYIYSLKDYIFEKMTGEWVVDKSSASASGLYMRIKWIGTKKF